MGQWCICYFISLIYSVVPFSLFDLGIKLFLFHAQGVVTLDYTYMEITLKAVMVYARILFTSPNVVTLGRHFHKIVFLSIVAYVYCNDLVVVIHCR